MRKAFFTAIAFVAIVITSCSSEVKDVAKKVSDPVFRAYCVSVMDLDGDRMVSLAEADSVKTIDVSGLGIKSLAGLEYFRNLKSLDCSGNQVKSFDFQLPALEVLKCANNENLTTIDLSGCPSLSFIYASHTGVKSLSLASQAGLYRLWLDNTPISELDITACPKLNNVNVQDCPNLKELTFSPEVNLDILYLVKDNALTVK